jgi:hypothetical protein
MPPSPPKPSEFRLAWMRFTDSVKPLLVAVPDDRPLDQFLPFREKVYSIIQGKEFLEELDKSWIVYTDYPLHETGQALLMEMNAFTFAAEVAKETEPLEETTKKTWMGRLLGKASVVTGSVKDIISDLPPMVKNGITLFKEAIDIFKKDSK